MGPAFFHRGEKSRRSQGFQWTALLCRDELTRGIHSCSTCSRPFHNGWKIFLKTDLGASVILSLCATQTLCYLPLPPSLYCRFLVYTSSPAFPPNPGAILLAVNSLSPFGDLIVIFKIPSLFSLLQKSFVLFTNICWALTTVPGIAEVVGICQ